ncbi:response regulator [Chitinispirillales bacterium ANBcel5]|uniref:response regulator transcription factor n=1 Tax=Cellulosispirillum alkaliphilum TaxID=3039283 RepID=UPI002A57028A|nr:response regulator [Chitinispirillales bacterium ANBcel5]
MTIDVLIIEDEKALSELVKVNFTLRNISVIVAQNGSEGIRFAYKHKPKVILLDVRLPDIDGWEICKKLKTGSDNYMPIVVFLTAATQKSDKEMARESGGDAFLEKPFEIKTLLKTVREFLDQKR